MKANSPSSASAFSRGLRPFRTAVLRGLAVVAPPLLTLVILLWVIRTLDYYILDPVVAGTRNLLVSKLSDIRSQLPPDARPTAEPNEFDVDGELFRLLPKDGQYIPEPVYDAVRKSPGTPPPETALEIYRRWVDLTYLRPWIVVPLFIVVFVGLMYLLGSLFAAGLGRAFWGRIELGVERLPVVRTVYNAAKQVTDYIFSERELEFTRVVAVEYPCRGIWSLAFVTNEGFADVESVTGEPMLVILLPTSPVPVSGYTMLIPKSEVLDVDITVEQAIQYIVSCGVVVPREELEQRITAG